LGTNLPDISAVSHHSLKPKYFFSKKKNSSSLNRQRVELKRHERHRLLQRQTYEHQMRALESQKPSDLLGIPFDSNAPQHLAVSAPTTPPRINAVLNGEIPLSRSGLAHHTVDVDVLFSKVVGSAATPSATTTPPLTVSPSIDKKLVTYAPSVDPEPLSATTTTTGTFARTAGAKSMPASRRTSASEHDDDLAGHLQSLTLAGERSLRTSPAPGPIPHSVLKSAARYAAGEEVVRFRNPPPRFDHSLHAGMMLDKQLDQEMHSEPSTHSPSLSPSSCH
jgi:hypothetical protein